MSFMLRMSLLSFQPPAIGEEFIEETSLKYVKHSVNVRKHTHLRAIPGGLDLTYSASYSSGVRTRKE